jgi:hypothetical protein
LVEREAISSGCLWFSRAIVLLFYYFLDVLDCKFYRADAFNGE